MLASHYAPKAKVVLVTTASEALSLSWQHEGSWVLDRTDDLVD